MRILLYDLETSLREVYTWGEYEQNVVDVIHESYILCISYKWLGEKETHVISLPDFPSYKRDKRNDKQLVKIINKLQDEADIVIGHNADRFDNKWCNKQFVKHGLSPPSPYRSVDTLKIARKHFNFQSNKLDRLGEFLGVGRKVKHEGKDLWISCMRGDPEAWKRMQRYAKQDVDLLEAVFHKLKPWAKDALYTQDETCNRCGSYTLLKRGFETLKSGMTYQRLQCKSCGGWLRARKGERVATPPNLL